MSFVKVVLKRSINDVVRRSDYVGEVSDLTNIVSQRLKCLYFRHDEYLSEPVQNSNGKTRRLAGPVPTGRSSTVRKQFRPVGTGPTTTALSELYY